LAGSLGSCPTLTTIIGPVVGYSAGTFFAGVTVFDIYLALNYLEQGLEDFQAEENSESDDKKSEEEDKSKDEKDKTDENESDGKNSSHKREQGHDPRE